MTVSAAPPSSTSAGTPLTIAADVREKKRIGIDIIGPECAVPLNAKYENMRVLAEEVKRG